MDIDIEKKRKRDEHNYPSSSRSSYDDRHSKSYRESRYDDVSSSRGGPDDRYYNGNRDMRRDDRDDRYYRENRRDDRDYRDERYYRDNRDNRRDDRDFYDDRDKNYNRNERISKFSQGPPPSSSSSSTNSARDSNSTTNTSNPHPNRSQTIVLQQPQQPTKEELEKQRELEKQKDQEAAEEEMRKRRERVEAWRKQKEAENKDSTTTLNQSTGTTTNTGSVIPKKWSLEDDDDHQDEKSTISNSAKKNDEVDPLDAFMDELDENEPKKKVELIEDDDEYEFELEDEDQGDETKVKKGKSEILQVDHTKIDYAKFEKTFYVEVPSLASLTETEVLDYRSELGLKITGKNCPKPLQTWSQAGLNEKVFLLLKKYNYEKPTPIQSQTIPAAMSGRDLIGIARTGSGKTLAFLLPMFRHILAQPLTQAGEGPTALIMSPTRELALQIFSECKKFSKVLGLRVACVYGGASMSEQIADLKRGAEIVVCTPGRMIDILCANNKRITNLQKVTFLVLDEADRMFDLGFGPQIMCIVDNIRPDRQTIMFSATFPPKVENAAKRILTKPLEIIAGGRSVVSADIEQIVEVRPHESKYRRLTELLSTWYHKGQILIFTNKQETTDNLFRLLLNSKFNCLSLHGNKDQTDRDETIQDFKSKVKTILIATPLASRGLDIKDLNCVINFDCPDHLEDYVHRVGRTGRAGNKGTAYTFITPQDERFASSIIKALEQSNTKVPDELLKLEKDYLQKRADGKEVLTAPTGFTGRGHKFDANEENKKVLDRKAQRKAYGLEEDDEEVEIVETEEKEQPTTNGTSTSPNTNETPTETNSTTTPTTTSTSSTQKEVSIEAQAIAQVLGSNTVTSTQDIIKSIQEAAKAQIPSKPVITKAIPLLNSNVNTSHYQEELEINDYSQQARWKATHKDSLLSITDYTNTSITAKGKFYLPTAKVPIGERKLYLLIEGQSETAVKTAKSEIKKILDTTQALSNDKGKYSVF